MWEIDRSIVVVKPKEPYIEWVHSLDEEGKKFTLTDLRQDNTAYLIPQYVDNDHREQLLAECYEPMFEQELAGWVTDRATWPPKRDLAMFRQWFDVEFFNMVIDVVDEPIEYVEADR